MRLAHAIRSESLTCLHACMQVLDDTRSSNVKEALKSFGTGNVFMRARKPQVR